MDDLIKQIENALEQITGRVPTLESIEEDGFTFDIKRHLNDDQYGRIDRLARKLGVEIRTFS